MFCKKQGGKDASILAPILAETVGFEPTCPSLDKTISSRSRYDHFDTSPYLIFKHRLARYLEKCKISMQDNVGKIGCAPKEKPAVKPFPADKLTKRRESFECGPFNHLGTSPYSPAHKRAILYYNRFGGPRQRETRSKRGGRAKGGSAGLRGPDRANRPFGRGRGAAVFSFAPFGARPAFFSHRAPAYPAPSPFSPSPPGAVCPRPGPGG